MIYHTSQANRRSDTSALWCTCQLCLPSVYQTASLLTCCHFQLFRTSHVQTAILWSALWGPAALKSLSTCNLSARLVACVLVQGMKGCMCAQPDYVPSGQRDRVGLRKKGSGRGVIPIYYTTPTQAHSLPGSMAAVFGVWCVISRHQQD